MDLFGDCGTGARAPNTREGRRADVTNAVSGVARHADGASIALG